MLAVLLALLALLSGFAIGGGAAAAEAPTLGVRSRGDVQELTLRWRGPVAAAAFSRAGRLWLLFEQPEKAAPPQLPAPSEPAPDEPAPGGQAFASLRLHAHPSLLVLSMDAPAAPATLTRRKGTWTLALGGEAATPEAAIEASPGGELRIGGGRPFEFDDPVVGDRLGVVLLPGSARGELVERRLPLVDVLASLQGVVWRARADGWAPRIDGEAVVLPGTLAADIAGGSQERSETPVEMGAAGAEHPAHAGSPRADPAPLRSVMTGDATPHEPAHAAGKKTEDAASGLPAAPVHDHAGLPAGVPASAGEPPAGEAPSVDVLPPALTAPEPGPVVGSGGLDGPARAALALADAKIPDGVALRDHRRQLEQRLATARGADRVDARLALVRLLVAHELAAEGLATLSPLRVEVDDAAVGALAGAAALLAGRAEEASRELGQPALDHDPEVQLWRAVAAAGRGDWPAARRLVEDAAQLPDYPPGLRFRIGLDLARIELHAGRSDAALAELDRLEPLAPTPAAVAELRLVEAEALAQQGDTEAADAARLQASREGDVPVALAAAHAATMSAFAQARLPASEALATLLAARSSWRGHADEVAMTTDLGRVAAAAGDLPAAIDAWRAAGRRATETAGPHAGEEARRLVAQHLLAAISGEDTATTPLQALTLLRQGEAELLPEGAARAEIERRLARRLADAGYDAPATALLGLRAGLAGSAEERGAAGAAIARGRAAEGRYREAAVALQASGPEESLPEALREERRHLAALAAARGTEGGRLPPELAGDNGHETGKLRLALAVLAGDWAGVEASAGALLAGDAGSAAPEREQVAAALAVAQARQGRDAELAASLDRLGDLAPLSERSRALLAMLGSSPEPVLDLAATAKGLELLRSYLASTAPDAS